MMTNIDIDRNLLKEAQALGNYKTKKATVNEALAEYVRTRKQQKILELFGKIDFDSDYDYKGR
ncbi:MAG: type II toxin-antitoxin system VapB family antitoxin [Armatimonadota bacterium]|nr:type II toxin-antitoxin system VapB family antitoxin [Armatimonadota bacterium]